MDFTGEQLAVIEHQEGNLLVSAAAGSGKTTVLVERIVQMLLRSEQPVSLEEILVVTFTNAAAHQMKEKIEGRLRLALMEAAEKGEEEKAAYLEEQYHAVSMASIMTNDAFCIRLLKDYITRIQTLDSGFRIADETELALLRVDILGQVLEQFYTEALAPDPDDESRDFLALVDAYGGSRQDTGIEELVLRIHQFMQSDPEPFTWLEKATLSGDISLWEDRAAAEVKRQIAKGKSFCKALMKLYQEAGDEAYAEQIKEKMDTIDETKPIEELSISAKVFAWFKKTNYAAFKKDPVAEAKAKDLVPRIKKAFEEAGAWYDMIWEPEARKRQEKHLMPPMRALGRLVKAFADAYAQAKSERNLAEFSDCEHKALEILQDEDVAEELRQRYRYIFIDEYQDSNRLQEAIVARIARTDENGQAINVFMVGDVKQSIYRFRQADPSLFIEKYQIYGKKEGTNLLILGRNFRSEIQVVETVNFIFEALMEPESGELSYGDKERLYAGKDEDRTVPESSLCVLESVDKMNSGEKQEAEAALIAEKIKKLKEEGTAYRDIVILLRSAKSNGETYRRILTQNGIPVYTEASENFYDTQEIQTIINLLHVLDNPHQDIPLLGVLYSPIFGFTENELGMIRLAAPEQDFFEALTIFAEKSTEAAGEKARKCLEKIEDWRGLSRQGSIHDLLWKLYEETNYYLYASSMPGGQARRANLNQLLEKSAAFEKGIYSGLYHFLRYVDKMNKQRESEDEAKLLGEDEDVVRIMTIHHSKGLEFPVVFVAGLGKKWNTEDSKKSMILHRDLGIGADIIDSQHLTTYPSPIKELIKGQIYKEMIAEEMRLLYVAMTRAQRELFLVGSRGEKVVAETSEIGWKMSAQEVLDANCFLDWVETIACRKAMRPFQYEVRQVEPEEEKDNLQELDRSDTGETPIGIEMPLVESLFAWQYPNEWKRGTPVRLSVSEIKRRQSENRDTEEAPIHEAFFVHGEDEKGGEGGAARGTAFHTVMALADWMRFADKESLEKELLSLQEKGKLSLEEYKLVNRDWLLRFGRSSLYSRIQKAEDLHREKPFMMSIPLKELADLSPPLSYGGEDDTMMIQGMIDCYFRENNELILVDYKTDYSLEEERLAEYRLQLKLYAKALEAATGLPVKEKILYDVRRGKEILC